MSGEGVPQVGGLSLGLGQCEHLLLRHAGWHGNVALVNWMQGLVVGRDIARVAHGCGGNGKHNILKTLFAIVMNPKQHAQQS